jgi:hypothetical protein
MLQIKFTFLAMLLHLFVCYNAWILWKLKLVHYGKYTYINYLYLKGW